MTTFRITVKVKRAAVKQYRLTAETKVKTTLRGSDKKISEIKSFFEEPYKV